MGPPPSSPATARQVERLQSLERGLEVLAWMNRNGSGRSGQVARALRLTRSTTHRILGVLVELGLLRLDPASHQYFLDAGVLELSRGFRDDPWVSGVAGPRLREWTARHHWPLVLVTPVGGVPTVRVSTDHDSPISVDRFVPGEPMPLVGSAAGALQAAWSGSRAAGPGPEDDVAGFLAADLRTIRRQGYYAAATACHAGARLGVPLLLDAAYVGCVIMRCLPETLASPRDCREWADSLKALAASIIEASDATLLVDAGAR
ncbi:MAG: helix-turn-helix domain-containing protein [Steroidobacteraceae bacterium]|jgi:IclR family mhp operon transcriptional activator|nr:helix-turn-helix domain-containing protein [Steroidobacteraceae bacterium]